jgi:serine-type D-Ala-D-Ala carboxypeptidase (penicillin-binding protein 5/6)
MLEPPEPPIVPPPSRRPRPRRRPSRARRTVGLSAYAVAIVALLVTVVRVTDQLMTSTHGSSSRRHGRSGHATPAPVALSPAGLPLGRPALPLGLRDPTADPMHLRFAHPPRAGLVFDLDTGRVLWQLRPLRRLPIASLTKMMTALIVVRSAPAHARVLITRQARRAPGSRVGLLPLGRRVELETLLYGLLLPSGNDAAVALAQHVAGSVRRFVAEMNAEAARRGLSCTRFSSPSGYWDADNFSCAADLAELADDDLRQPRIARAARSARAALPFPIKGGRLWLTNNNPLLLYGYPDTTGLKTGYTEAAGPCLVATARRDGVRLGVVLLHSRAPGTQAANLLDAAFDRVYRLKPAPHPPIPAGV